MMWANLSLNISTDNISSTKIGTELCMINIKWCYNL